MSSIIITPGIEGLVEGPTRRFTERVEIVLRSDPLRGVTI
jgi:hypothetical protein